MGVQHPNSTPYEHPNEPNLLDLHSAMDYDSYGYPYIRVGGKPNSAGVAMSWADSASITSFGRGRVSTTRLLGDYRYMYGSGVSTEMNDLTAGSGTLVANQVRNCYLANVTTAANDRVVRQTKQYHPYISGTSNLFFITYVMESIKENLVQAVGAFDDYNGIFFRMNGLTPEVVVRKNGADVEVIPQEDWNIDRFDGSHTTDPTKNPSHVDLDFTKGQILTIDYQWLGIGRARIGFVINGVVYHAHHFNHANVVTEVYTNQPSLPCRWEIYNNGTTESNSTLMIICAGVYCEGSDNETGFQRSVSTGTSTVSLTTANSSNGRGILAIRLKNIVVDNKPNHSLARLKSFSIASNQDIRFKIVILKGAASIFDSPVWTALPGYSWCEYLTNFALATDWNTNNDFAVIEDDFVSGAQNNKQGSVSLVNEDNRTSAIYQNYNATDSQILAVIGYRLSSDAEVRASLKWLEVK